MRMTLAVITDDIAVMRKEGARPFAAVAFVVELDLAHELLAPPTVKECFQRVIQIIGSAAVDAAEGGIIQRNVAELHRSILGVGDPVEGSLRILGLRHGKTDAIDAGCRDVALEVLLGDASHLPIDVLDLYGWTVAKVAFSG